MWKHWVLMCPGLGWLRNRLRCPICGAVGTFKPHGWWFTTDKKSGKRWLCKWCGYYTHPQRGTRLAFVDLDLENPCWRILDWYNEEFPSNTFVPKYHVDSYVYYLTKKRFDTINPWCG